MNQYRTRRTGIQFFAEPADPQGEAAQETTQAPQDGGEMTFDQWLDSNPAFRSEFDRRATKAVNTARANWEREQSEEQDEAAKLARMTAAQRERYQLDKDKADFAARQAEFARQQLQVQVGQDLQRRGLSADFARFLTGKDAEESAANLEAFQGLWNAGITAAVTGRMRGGTPPKEPEKPAGLTRESLAGMSPAEIVKAYESGQLDTLLGKK